VTETIGAYSIILENTLEVIRAAELADVNIRNRTIAAIHRGTLAVVSGAEHRAPKRTGTLAWTIRGEFSKDGLTGFAKAGYGKLLRRSKSRTAAVRDRHLRKLADNKLQARLAGTSKQALSVSDLGVFAPVVERGDARRHHRAHPFMIPSYKAEAPRIEQSILAAAQTGITEAGFAS
jgi:hypothetical protein